MNIDNKVFKVLLAFTMRTFTVTNFVCILYHSDTETNQESIGLDKQNFGA